MDKIKRETAPRWVKEALPRRCCSCGGTKDLHYHHIVPVIFGGSDALSNWAVVCGNCHEKIHYTNQGGIDHGQAVKRGLARAKANGKKLGKPPADHEKIMRAIAEHSSMFLDDGAWTESEIAESVGVGTTTYYKCKRMLLQELDKPNWEHNFKRPKLIRKMPFYDWYIKELRCSGDI